MRWTEIASKLNEAASMAGKTLYHGTPLQASAVAIQRDGLKGAEVQGRGMLAPVAGRVYMTPSLPYGIIYALGGDMAGHDVPPNWLEKSRYGYLFIINGDDLDTVEPDEDSIGEWLYKTHHRMKGGDKLSYEDQRLYLHIKDRFTDRQFAGSIDGLYAAWASGGKRALKTLSPQDKVALVDRGAHVHHASGVTPRECWQIDKARTKELAKDGSNFFQIAKRVS